MIAVCWRTLTLIIVTAWETNAHRQQLAPMISLKQRAWLHSVTNWVSRWWPVSTVFPWKHKVPSIFLTIYNCNWFCFTFTDVKVAVIKTESSQGCTVTGVKWLWCLFAVFVPNANLHFEFWGMCEFQLSACVCQFHEPADVCISYVIFYHDTSLNNLWLYESFNIVSSVGFKSISVLQNQ
jgi:hypothetical protein